VSEASEAVLAALGDCSMQDPANGLRRIPLPRTWVNKARRRTGDVFATLG
jgi:hypothetical protein